MEGPGTCNSYREHPRDEGRGQEPLKSMLYIGAESELNQCYSQRETVRTYSSQAFCDLKSDENILPGLWTLTLKDVW